uniref:BSD domain-containing protein n=1 Tax=Trichuris muris TaxID=70415 RepID=A0A5S6QDR4_TRIMR
MKSSPKDASDGDRVAAEQCDGALESNADPARIGSRFLPSLSGLLSSIKSGTDEIIGGASKLIKDAEVILLTKTALGEVFLEQQKFVEQQSTEEMASQAVLPWAGCEDEYSIKKQCLSLSMNEDNLLREPPAGCDFSFNFSSYVSQARGALEADSNLQQLRFALVPKKISEEAFWRNYFYRVSLIKRAAKQEAPLPTGESNESKKSDIPYSSEREWENQLLADLDEYELVAAQNSQEDSKWIEEVEKALDEEIGNVKNNLPP